MLFCKASLVTLVVLWTVQPCHALDRDRGLFYMQQWSLVNEPHVLCQDTIALRFNTSVSNAPVPSDSVVRIWRMIPTGSGSNFYYERIPLKLSTRWSRDSTTVFCIPEGGFPYSAVDSIGELEVVEQFELDIFSTGWRLFGSEPPIMQSVYLGVPVINNRERHPILPGVTLPVFMCVIAGDSLVDAENMPTSFGKPFDGNHKIRSTHLPIFWQDTVIGAIRHIVQVDALFEDRPFVHWITNDPRIDVYDRTVVLQPAYCWDPWEVALHRRGGGTAISRSSGRQYNAVYGEVRPRKSVVITTDSFTRHVRFQVEYGQPRGDRHKSNTYIGSSEFSAWGEKHDIFGSESKNRRFVYNLVQDSSEYIGFLGLQGLIPKALESKGSYVLESNNPAYSRIAQPAWWNDSTHWYVLDPMRVGDGQKWNHIYPFFPEDTLFLHFRWVYDEPQNVLENVSARMTLAPNPSNGSTVRLDLPAEVYQRKTRVTIVDIVGRTIAAYDADNATSLELDCSTFPSGTYQVHLQAGPWFGSKPLHIVR